METQQRPWYQFRRYPELWVLLGCSLVLGVLRLLAVPLPGPLATALGLALFLLPGAAVVCLIGDGDLWWERLALAFVASAAVVGLVSQAAIFLHTDIAAVLWGYLILTVPLAVGAIVRGWQRREVAPQKGKDHVPAWLWLILVLMVVILGLYQWNSPLDGDHLDAQAYIQNILSDPHMMAVEPKFGADLPVSPRFDFSAWLVDQAFVAFVTGQNPWDQFQALRLPLMLLTLAAFYRLCRVLMKRSDIAVGATILWILYLITSTAGTVAGYEVIVRSDLDKVVAGFIVVPLSLSVIMDIFEHRRPRDWMWLAMSALAAGLTHPIASALIGLSLIWFGIAELWFERSRATVARLGLAAGILILLSLTPSVYSYIRGKDDPESTISAVSMTDTRDPSMSRRLRGTFDRERIWILDGGYIMHPRLILQPLHIPVFLALPLVFSRQRRSRAARLLFGMVTVIPILVLFPKTAGILGQFTTPWLFYRLHWPISMAAAILLAWLVWEFAPKVAAWGAKKRMPLFASRAQAVLPIAGWLVVMLLAFPAARTAFSLLADWRADTRWNVCIWAEPLLRQFQELDTSDTVILAEQDLNNCLIGYAPYSDVMEWRTVNVVRNYIGVHREDEGWERLSDARYYSQSDFADDRLLAITRKWGNKYLVVRLDSPLETQLRHLPSVFRPVSTAFHRRIYEIVDSNPQGNVAALLSANGLLTSHQWSDAVEPLLRLTAEGDPDIRFLALLGLGKAYVQTDQLDLALDSYRQASALMSDDQAFTLQGQVYFLSGDLKNALSSFQQAVDLQPENEPAWTRLGDLHYALGDPVKAEQAYAAAAALENNPGTMNYYVGLGLRWLFVGDNERAAQDFVKGAAVFDDADALYMAGEAYRRQAKFNAAEDVYRRLVMSDPWSYRSHTGLAAIRQAQGDYASAISEYQIALLLHPLAQGAYKGLADIWQSQQGTPFAIEALQRLAGYRLGFGDALVVAGNLRARLGDYAKAVADARQAIKWDRVEPGYLTALAGYQFEMGQLDDARASFRQALDLDGTNESALIGLERVEASLGRPVGAAGYAYNALIKNPHTATPYLTLAELFQQAGQPASASVMYQRALKSTSGTVTAWIANGHFQIGQGRLDDAISSFRSALEIEPTAAAYHGLGSVYLGRGQMTEAADAFRKAVQLNPGDGALQASLGTVLNQQGDSKGGADQFRKAIEMDPGRSLGYLRLAETKILSGEPAQSEEVYQALMDANPGIADGLVGLGKLYERQGKSEDAAALYRAALTQVAPALASGASIALADLQARQGSFDEALANYQNAIRQQPASPDGYVALAEFYQARGDWKSAASVVQQGMAIMPGSPALNLALGRLQANQGNAPEAVRTYTGFLAKMPGSLETVRALAELYALTGNPGQGLAEVEARQSVWLNNVQLLSQRIDLESRLGNPQGALESAKQLVDTSPGAASAWVQNSRAQLQAGRIEAAADALRQATAREPGNSLAWLALGQFQVEQGLSSEGLSALRSAIAADQSNLDSHLALGDALLRNGQTEEAAKEYGAAANLDGLRGDALIRLGRVQQQMGNLPEASKLFERAIAASINDADAYRAQSDVSLQQGQYEQARKTLEKATQAAPGDCRAFENLGDLFAARGDWANARANYARALTLAGCAASGHVALGNLYLVQAKTADATEEYKAAIAAEPGNAFPYVVLGDFYTSQIRWSEANQVFQEAESRIPGSDLVLVGKARSLLMQGNLQESYDALKKSVRVRPGSMTDSINLGRTAEVLARFDEAEKAYRDAAALDQSSPAPQVALGDLYSRSSRFDDAKSAYERAIAIAPGQYQSYDAYAVYQITRGQMDAAMQTLQRGLEANKAQLESLLVMGQVNVRLGKTAAAEQNLRQAIGISAGESTPYNSPDGFQSGLNSPSVADVYVALGDLYRLQGSPKAEEYYRKAIAAAPANPTGYIQLGRYLQAQARATEATQQFQLGIKMAPRSAQAYIALGDLDRLGGDQAMAEQIYYKAIGAAPANASGYVSLGSFYQAAGQRDKASSQYQAGSAAAPASAQVYVALGDLHRSQANWSTAEQWYQKALQVAPAYGMAYVGLGLTYQSQADLVRAVEQLQKAVQVNPASAAAYVALGDHYRGRGDWKNAEQAYLDAVKHSASSADGYIGLAQTLLAQGQPSKALTQLQAAVKNAPASVSAAVALGDLYRLQGDWKNAEQAYQKAIVANSAHPSGYIGLGLALDAQGKNAEALAQFQAAGRAAPTSGEALEALGNWYRSQGDWGQAEQYYQKAIQYEPNNAQGYVGLGKTYWIQGLTLKALAQYQAATRAAPAQVDGYLALAELYLSQANWQAAGETYRQAVKMLPASASAFVALGDYAQLQADIKSAEENYRQAIAIAPAGTLPQAGMAPGDPEGYIRLGALYQAQGRSANSGEAFKTAVQAAPGSVAAYVALGNWYMSQANPGDANKAFQSAIKTGPSSPLGYVAQSDAYQAQGRHADALTQLRSGSALNAGNVALLINQGGYYISRGDAASAAQALRQAVALEPGNVEARTALAQAYERQGLLAEAESLLNETIKLAPGDPAAYVALAEYHATRRNWSAALAAYQQALAQSTTDPWARQGLIKVRLVQNRVELALAEAERWVKEAAPGATDAQVTLGVVKQMAGDWSGASAVFEATMSRWPGNVDACVGWSQSLKAQGRFEESTACADRLVSLVPGAGAVRLSRGESQLVLGKLDLALEDFRQAAKSSGNQAAPLIAQAKLMVAQDNPAEGIKLYQQAIAAYPTDLEPYALLTALYISLQQNSTAAATAEQAAGVVGPGHFASVIRPLSKLPMMREEATTPAGLQAQLLLANARTKNGDMGGALKSLEVADQKWPGNEGQTLVRRGRIYATFGYKDLARDSYARALSLYPKEIGALLGEGDLYLFNEGKFDKAIELYEQAAAIDGRQWETYFYVLRAYGMQRYGGPTPVEGVNCPDVRHGRCNLQIGDVTIHTGLSWVLQTKYEANLEANPDSIEALMRMAMFYEAFHLDGPAVDAWERLVKLYPNDPGPYLRLGTLLTRRVESRTLAARTLGQALVLGPDLQDVYNMLVKLHRNHVTSPTEGAPLKGTVEIRGTASGTTVGLPSDFAFYKIEIGEDPARWRVGLMGKEQVVENVLATWDTTTVPNGTYKLRLTVVDRSGNYGPWHEIEVQVKN